MSRTMTKPPDAKTQLVRCAIYTRKSTEDGLEQEFNSLDTQRESGEAYIMEAFDKRKVAFVSVTQALNTASSMGRLILNVLLSFAQFERDMISERTHDKIAAARRKGKWSGGMPVHGYTVENTKLMLG